MQLVVYFPLAVLQVKELAVAAIVSGADLMDLGVVGFELVFQFLDLLDKACACHNSLI